MTYFSDDLYDDIPENEYFIELIQENTPKCEFIEHLDNKYPGWYAMQFSVNHRYSMVRIMNWLTDPYRISYGKYKMIDWKTSKTTGYIVLFENALDVIKFKLAYENSFSS
jgi:hypothetical protein